MTKLILMLLLIGFCGTAQSDQKITTIEQQWFDGTFDQNALKAKYVSYCVNSEFEIDQSAQADLCALVAEDLLQSTILRSLTLDQYVNTVACSEDQDPWEDNCDPRQDIINDDIADAIVASLCHLESSLVVGEYENIVRRGNTIYDGTRSLFDCKKKWFFEDATAGKFTVHSEEIVSFEYPALYEGLRQKIKYDRESEFLVLLNRLSKSQRQAIGHRLLLSALEQENSFYVKNLLSSGIEANTAGNFFNQPLAKALALGRNDAVVMMLDAGANPNVFDEEGYSGLYRAVENCSADVIDLLLDLGVGADGQLENFGRIVTSPLSKAVEFGRVDVVKRLLAEGAAITWQQDSENYHVPSLFEMAMQGGNEEILNLLIARGVEPTAKYHHLLIKSAIKGGSANILKTLLAMGIEIPADKHGDILFELKNSSPGSTNEEYPYKEAVQYQRADQLDILVAHGLNIEYKDGGAFDFITRLTSIYSDPTKITDPITKMYHEERVALTLRSIQHYADAGLDLNHINRESLLMDAVSGEYLRLVELLLELGADKNKATESGKTALSIAGYRLNKKIADYPKWQDNRADIEKIYTLLGGDLEDLPPQPKKRPKSLGNMLINILNN